MSGQLLKLFKAFSGASPVFKVAAALALSSVAVLGFQLVMMQMLSVAQWHHFAYMVISMAMLGFGTAGTFLVLFKDRLKENHRTIIPAGFLLASVSMALSAWFASRTGNFDVFLLFMDWEQVQRLLTLYLIWALPFFFAGLSITLAFFVYTKEIGSLYFANMIGSGVGSGISVLLLWVIPLVLMPGFFALMMAASALIILPPGRLFRSSFALTVFICIGSVFVPVLPEPSEYKDISKALNLPDAEIVHESFSPYGKVQILEAPALRFAPSLSMTRIGEPPVYPVMYNNGHYFGTISGVFEPGEHILDYTTRSLPFEIRTPELVAVLGAGTGMSASHALSKGAERVIMVESNRHALDVLKREASETAGQLLNHPGLSLWKDHPRRFLSRYRGQNPDLIITPVLGSFGGTSGVGSMDERFELTSQAFEKMWDRLSDEGIIATTVWADFPPRYVLKLLATWRNLLEAKELEPSDHVAAVRSWGTMTLILSKSPFTKDEISNIREYSQIYGYDPLLLPDIEDHERKRFNIPEDDSFFAQVDQVFSGDFDAFQNEYFFDIRPATDNRPFFAAFVTPGSLSELLDEYGISQLPYVELGFMLAFVTMFQIILVSLLLILLPLMKISWEKGKRRNTFFYFAGTGFGFMFFEISLIQQFILTLGQPVYSAALVISVILIASGAGSYYSKFLKPVSGNIRALACVIAGIIITYILMLSWVFSFIMNLHIAAGIFLAIVILGIPAFFMGMMFPLGLRRLQQADDSHIPWACGIDSFMSVSATAIATMAALLYGFSIVLLIAAGGYLICALSVKGLGNAA